jgi:hypothetical protein
MPEPSVQSPASPVLDGSALRIVLFGMPDAGKSSLLGALAQTAQTQEHVLNGHLTDLTHGLAELQRRLYEERPRETLEEVVPYPVKFEAFSDDGRAAAPPVEAVLVDCDGRVANELLARRRFLREDGADGHLARAILQADALILVVDASAPPAQVESDFTEFGRFLRLLEQSRGRRSEVGGLPVFLVLAKCDLLAQPGDTTAAWLERVDQRKEQVARRFREFLAGEAAKEPLPFGRLELHVWATAVKRPELANTPARPRDPHGVAELFRQAFHYARGFQQRRSQAGHRLLYTLAGTTGVVAVLAALAVGFLLSPSNPKPSALAGKIDIYRVNEGLTASERLRQPVQPKISQLKDLKNDPEFDTLTQELKAYVDDRLRELEEYQAYWNRLQRVPDPGTVDALSRLAEIEERLRAQLDLPPQHREEWAQTEAALLRQRLLQQIRAIQAAVENRVQWYDRLRSQAELLRTFSRRDAEAGAPFSWREWHERVRQLLREAEAPPPAPDGGVRPETVHQLDKVVEARAAWEAVKERLERVRDLSAVLGLAGPVDPQLPPLLEIRDQSRVPADQAQSLLKTLEEKYPRFREGGDSPEQLAAELGRIPEAIAGEIRRAARRSYEQVLEAGHEVVLWQVQAASPQGRETPESWRKLREWLKSPDELRAWRRLATLLARISDPDAPDPVTALFTFLGKESFDLELRRLTLEIPDELRLRVAGRLTVHHLVGDKDRPLAFELQGEGRRDRPRGVTAYTFVPAGDTRLTYRPGEELWAELPLKDADNRDWVFTWSVSRSRTYKFERLLRESPRLHRPGQDVTQAEIVKGVTLTVTPEDGVPKVPDLLPVVKLEAR